MKPTTRKVGNIIVLDLQGRFDAHTASAAAEAIEKSLTPPARMVVNLAAVNFLDSTALATLVQGMKRCRQAGGDLRLAHPQQSVRIIFELTRLDKALDIYPTEADALQSFEAQ
jgi:anti-sigma B factor antagonist